MDLEIYAGRIARARLKQRGWDPDVFTLLLGASGGPKWLVLSQLDRVLFGEFLSRRDKPLHALGTSIGSWRHACLAQADPVAAVERLERAYIQQRFDTRPTPAYVSEVGRGILDEALGETGAREIVESARVISHIGAVRGRGLLGASSTLLQAPGLGLAAVMNALGRAQLERWFQRVLFSTGGREDHGFRFRDFDTRTVKLTEANVRPALMASGSIPLVLEGVRDPPGAPPGLYWDGGVVDYHHDLSAYDDADGLILYPHFYPHLVPGWFDKALGGRRAPAALLERVVLLTPSRGFVDALPGAKIPDRKDFEKLSTDDRYARWWEVTDRCRALADDLRAVLDDDDPLRHVRDF